VTKPPREEIFLWWLGNSLKFYILRFTFENGDFMSLKLINSNIYVWLCGCLRSIFLSRTGRKPANDHLETSQRNKGGRPPVPIDMNEVLRLRHMDWSFSRIARHLRPRPAVSTLISRFKKWDRTHPAPLPTPTPVPPVPVVISKPVIAQPAPSPAPAPVLPPPEPYGLDSIPAGCKAFFLVCGELNAIYAHGYAQPAVGIETWHHAYASLPAFQAAERIWVVVTANDEHRAFVLSLAADTTIRERFVISVGEVHGNMNHVQSICKRRFLWERAKHSASIMDPAFRLADRSDFEKVHGFQPIPQPNQTDKLAALVASPSEPDRSHSFGHDPWPRKN